MSKVHLANSNRNSPFLQLLLEAQQADSEGSSNKYRNTSSSSRAFFLGRMVLSAQVRQLPNNIERDLPHIILPIVSGDTTVNPTITGILDTEATLTAKYISYFIAISERYPELAASIMWADKETGYNPVTLSCVCA